MPNFIQILFKSDYLIHYYSAVIGSVASIKMYPIL